MASTVRRLVSGFKFEVSRETNSIGQTSTVVFPSGWRYDHPTRDAHAGPKWLPCCLAPLFRALLVSAGEEFSLHHEATAVLFVIVCLDAVPLAAFVGRFTRSHFDRHRTSSL